MSEEKQVRWPYGEKLREGSSIQAILNYIAGTDGLSERQALWEFAQKKQNGEYPWDGGGGPGAPGPPGEDGKGWTGGSYDDASGVVTFTSDDGLGFATDDLRGADGVSDPADLISGDADNSMVLGSDNKLYTPTTQIDVDAAGTKDFGTTGPPLRFFGVGRPDGRKDGADDPTSLITAPNGSTYTYTGPNVNNSPAFGARQWIMVDQKWQVVSGAIGGNSLSKDGWGVRFHRTADECKIFVEGRMDTTKPPPNFVLEFTENAEKTRWGLTALGVVPVFRRSPIPDYVGAYYISASSTTMVMNWYKPGGTSYYPKYKDLHNKSPQFTRYEEAQQCMGQVTSWQNAIPSGWPSAAIELSDTVYSNEELQQMEAEYLKTLEADDA